MHPAHERFESDHLAAPQVDLRLVVEAQLILLHRLPQLGLEPEPIHRVSVERLVEEDVPAPPLFLGVRQRDVGAPNQVAWLHGPLAAQGDPDAGGHDRIVPE